MWVYQNLCPGRYILIKINDYGKLILCTYNYVDVNYLFCSAHYHYYYTECWCSSGVFCVEMLWDCISSIHHWSLRLCVLGFAAVGGNHPGLPNKKSQNTSSKRLQICGCPCLHIQYCAGHHYSHQLHSRWIHQHTSLGLLWRDHYPGNFLPCIDFHT